MIIIAEYSIRHEILGQEYELLQKDWRSAVYCYQFAACFPSNDPFVQQCRFGCKSVAEAATLAKAIEKTRKTRQEFKSVETGIIGTGRVSGWAFAAYKMGYAYQFGMNALEINTFLAQIYLVAALAGGVWCAIRVINGYGVSGDEKNKSIQAQGAEVGDEWCLLAHCYWVGHGNPKVPTLEHLQRHVAECRVAGGFGETEAEALLAQFSYRLDSCGGYQLTSRERYDAPARRGNAMAQAEYSRYLRCFGYDPSTAFPESYHQESWEWMAKAARQGEQSSVIHLKHFLRNPPPTLQRNIEQGELWNRYYLHLQQRPLPANPFGVPAPPPPSPSPLVNTWDGEKHLAF